MAYISDLKTHNSSNKATQMQHFNFHQKLKNYECLCNKQMRQTLNNILMHCQKKQQQQQHISHRIWCGLQPGQWVGRDVKIAIIYVRIKRDYRLKI